MANTIPVSQSETLQDRLGRRRRLRDKNYVNKKSTDKSEITSSQRSPEKTQSLDRRESNSITSPAISTYQRKLSPTKTQKEELPLVGNSFLKQTHLSSDNKTQSTPLLLQTPKNQPAESENEKPPSLEEQQEKYSHQDVKPVLPPIIPPANTDKSNTNQHETLDSTRENAHAHQDVKPSLPSIIPPTNTEKSNTNQHKTSDDTRENPHGHHDVKPVIIRKPVSPILPLIISPKHTEKSNINQQEIPEDSHEKPHSHRDVIIIKKPVSPRPTEKSNTNQQDIPEETREKPHSHRDVIIIKRPDSPVIPEKSNIIQKDSSKHTHESPLLNRLIPSRIKDFSQTSLDHPSSHPQSSTDNRTHFYFPSFHSKPIARTTSEQTFTINKHKSIDRSFSKPNSLALSYLFNKRMVDSELARTSSLDNKRRERKTVWD